MPATLKIIPAAVLLLALLLPGAAAGASPAKDLGTAGAVYPVAERDALEEILERARQVDWKRHFNAREGERKIRAWKPEGLPSLPRAERDRVLYRDLSWVLDFDVPDGRGGVLYPRGYRFNPLAHVTLPTVLVVIDGGDAAQTAWFLRSPWAKDARVMLILTDAGPGGWPEAMKRLGRPVHFAVRGVAERLALEAVPSVALQEGPVMKVMEFDPLKGGRDR